jgi:hypothetical protein
MADLYYQNISFSANPGLNQQERQSVGVAVNAELTLLMEYRRRINQTSPRSRVVWQSRRRNNIRTAYRLLRQRLERKSAPALLRFAGPFPDLRFSPHCVENCAGNTWHSSTQRRVETLYLLQIGRLEQ